MPTYAYACSDCGHRFEVRQSFSDSALTECPQCTGTVRKLFNTVGIVFKGSGFYRTDSRTATNGSAGGDTPNGKGESGKGESGKGESGKGESGKGESSAPAPSTEKKAAEKKPAGAAASTSSSSSGSAA